MIPLPQMILFCCKNIATEIVLEAGGVSGVKNGGLSLADPLPGNICSRGSATGHILTGHI